MALRRPLLALSAPQNAGGSAVPDLKIDLEMTRRTWEILAATALALAIAATGGGALWLKQRQQHLDAELARALDYYESPRAAALLHQGAHGEVTSADGDRTTPLLVACYRGDQPLIEYLLAHGANPNRSSDGLSPLRAAVISGRRAVVARLLAAGAAVNGTDGQGSTALMLAAHLGRRDLLELLLTAGAEVDAQDADGGTALLEACGRASSIAFLDQEILRGDTHTPQQAPWLRAALDPGTIERLLRAGADVNAVDRNGETALTSAAIHGAKALPAVKLLVARGARVNVRTRDGFTPILLAQGPVPLPASDPARPLVDFLRRAGAVK